MMRNSLVDSVMRRRDSPQLRTAIVVGGGFE
jgi:hypothetical protein